MKRKITSLVLLLSITGCNITPKPEYFQNKLNKMIQINGQFGAMIGYNTQRFNSSFYFPERYYQFQMKQIPTTQFEYQLNKMVRSKISGRYGITQH